MSRRIGIYPGSFDPVHSGHIAFGLETMRTCNLDEVVYIPERTPRGKADVTDVESRVALLEQLLSTIDGLRVIQLVSDQFTVKDTLPELRQVFREAELTLLVGSDIAKTFTYRWDGLHVLLAEVSLAIGLRDNDSRSDIRKLMEVVQSTCPTTISYIVIDTMYPYVSSSGIRSSLLAPDS